MPESTSYNPLLKSFATASGTRTGSYDPGVPRSFSGTSVSVNSRPTQLVSKSYEPASSRRLPPWTSTPVTAPATGAGASAVAGPGSTGKGGSSASPSPAGAGGS